MTTTKKRIIFVAVIIFILAIITAYAMEHILVIERNYRYRYGDDLDGDGRIRVDITQTVTKLNGEGISDNDFYAIWEIEKLPWYNRWHETKLELH